MSTSTLTAEKTLVPVGGSWCETCQVHLGGPVTGQQHSEAQPTHQVLLRTGVSRWARY